MSASTAEWVGIVRGVGLDPGDAFDAHAAREIRSNICHAADSLGQVRVCWVANGALAAPLPPVGVNATADARLVRTDARWPAPLRHDGATFRLRVSIAARVNAGSADVTLVYAPARAPRSLSGLGASAVTLSVSATTSAWSAPALLEMSPAQAAPPPTRRSTRGLAPGLDHARGSSAHAEIDRATSRPSASGSGLLRPRGDRPGSLIARNASG